MSCGTCTVASGYAPPFAGMKSTLVGVLKMVVVPPAWLVSEID